ncbi:hypothetical protein G5B00_13995 [Parapedobacter sp. SGR-10]|uniref:hypothetical protein n=1 Tax=Parapedobacter sp. SGR-10 TaxID=2710879 RepID=UPI0013D4BEA2|nr:hypothetical protein [Parapedobacter sp. SGR-10]NGF57626.1 hypothetical protein [Parapedobacter sp. SGR-10]
MIRIMWLSHRRFYYIVASLWLILSSCHREIPQPSSTDVEDEDDNNVETVLTDHGIVSAVSEGRGVIAHRTSSGNPIIIAVSMDRFHGRSRNSLLIIDARTGQTDQYWHPLDGPDGENAVSRECYSSMLASNGKFYTMFGNVFLEFDLDKREWTFQQEIEGRAMSFAEAPDGKIFFANFSQSTLYSFDPVGRELRLYGQLDDVQQYPYSLAVGDDGWVYAGIGTARNNIVAYNRVSGERRNLIPESERVIGEGYVFRGADGVIYATHLKGQKAPLFRLENGQKIEVLPTPSALPAKAVTGFIFWQQRINDFPGGGRIVEFILRDKRGQIVDENGITHTFTFDYATAGAGVTSLAMGPDGAIWGCTSHPIRLWRYDPDKRTMGDWNGINEISGGNFPNLITSGKHIYGALYNGGMVWRFDTSRPWNNYNNPLQLGTFAGIARPRAAAVTSDREHIVFGGYPGYGVVGGDLVFVNIVNGQAIPITVQDQIPGLSTICLRALDGGLLVGGTSTAAPGGGMPTATKAVLYLMDDVSRQIIFQIVPIPSGKDIMSLVVRGGMVYGITSDSQLFVFDPNTKKVTLQKDLRDYGTPVNPGQTLVLSDDGNIYGVMSRSIIKIDADADIVKLLDLSEHATAGIAFDHRKNKVYFASGANLWSYQIEL